MCPKGTEPANSRSSSALLLGLKLHRHDLTLIDITLSQQLRAAAKEEFCASAISQVGQGKPDLKLTKPQKLNYEQLYDDERTVDFPRRSLANSTGVRPDLQMCLLQIRQDLRICCRIQGLKTFCRKS